MLYDSRQYQQRLEQEARREQEQREMAKEKYELNAAVQRENEKARERGEDGPGVGTARNGNKRAVEKGRNRGGLAEEERTGELELRTIHRFCSEMISSNFNGCGKSSSRGNPFHRIVYAVEQGIQVFNDH